MKYALRLYVTGRSALSLRAVENLKTLCREVLDEYEIEVIDVLEHPQFAEEEDPRNSHAGQAAPTADAQDNRGFESTGQGADGSRSGPHLQSQ